MKKDYKHTLNLPQTDFPMKANLPQREPEWLAFWHDINLYQKLQAGAHLPLEKMRRFFLDLEGSCLIWDLIWKNFQ